MTLPRLFYKLPELAKHWGVTEDDILQMGATGQLKISMRYDGTVGAPTQGCNVHVGSHYLQLMEHDLFEILSTHCERAYYRIDMAMLHGDLVYSLNIYEPGTPKAKKQDTPPLYIFSCKDLLILTNEVERAESIWPDLKKDSTPEAQHNHDAKTKSDLEAQCLETRRDIEADLDMSWNTCKKHMKKFGITPGPDGKWRLPWSISAKIKAKVK